MRVGLTSVPRAASPKRHPHRWRRRLKVYGCLYLVVLVLIAFGVGDRLILFPSNDPIDTAGIVRHSIAMPDRGVVEVWAGRSSGASQPGVEPQAYVLSFIGNAARAEWTASYFVHDWANRPVEVWAVNYPGFGGSSGSARLKNIPPAALAAYDALRVHAGNKPIFVEARSLGTTAALYVAANRPVAGCLLHNPPPLKQLILQRHGWWNLWLLAVPISLTLPSELDSVANAQRVNVPAVFVLAGADEVVPPTYQQKVVDAYAGEKQLVRLLSASHNDNASGEGLIQYQMAMDWIWSKAVK